MKIMKYLQKASSMNDSTKEKQSYITIAEVSSLWLQLSGRYDAIESTRILRNFVRDEDLKKMLDDGLKVLNKQVKELESTSRDYGIPMPCKPPEFSNIALDVNAITDKYVFKRIYRGIQNFLSLHMTCFIHTKSSFLREKFRKFLNEETDLFDAMIEYGKLKGWLEEEPTFRP